MNFNDNSLYNCLVNRDGERYSLFDLKMDLHLRISIFRIAVFLLSK